MKYKVRIIRIEHRENTFEVEAQSVGEAQDLAFEEAKNHDFGSNPVYHATEELGRVLMMDEA